MRSKSDLRAAQQRTVTRFFEEPVTQAVIGMGGGKTAAALTAFEELKAENFADDMFVLAPKRVAQLVWPAEPRHWLHLCGLKVVLVAGTAAQRLAALRTPADIYAVGLDNTQWFVDWLESQHPARFERSVLCIDELSRLKNPRSKRARALFGYLNKNPKAFLAAWGLTGTPRPNGLIDQFNPLKVLTRGKLWGKSFNDWRKKNFYPTDYMQRNWAVREEREPTLMAGINSVSVTIPLSEMPDLPPLNAGPEFIEWVDMPRDVKPVYDRMYRHLVAELKAKGKVVTAANMAVASGKLEQLIQGFLYEDDDRNVTRFHDEKMDALLELIEQANGEPVAIAYQFVEDLARLQAEFPGIPYFGSGTTDKQAEAHERAWNRKELPLLAMHPASAGHGLNLQQGGSLLVHYGFGWSAEYYDQLIKRFHRPGMTGAFFSRPILMRGTIDEMKWDRVTGKIDDQALFQKLLNEV